MSNVGEEVFDDDNDGLDEDDIDQIDDDDTLSDDVEVMNVSSFSEESIELDSQGLGSFYNDVDNTKEY